MAKSDLLKEAIADAKAVKETALANAKIALQEVFAPRLEAMLQTKLQNEVEGEEETDAMGDTAVADTDAAAAADTGMDMPSNVKVGLDFDDDGNWDLEGMVGAEEEMGAEEAPVAAEPASDEEMTAEYNEGYHEGIDLDVESIIRELEEDMDPTEEGYHEGYEMNPTEEGVYEDYEMDPTEEGYHEGYHEGYESGDKYINEIIEAILREEDGMMMGPETAELEPESEVVDMLQTEIEEKDAKLKEAYRTVKHLQSVINEVNLLNAKLLYTNKLFRNFELNEAQKMKVIENFDRAANTREAKLVFATMAESFIKPTKKRVVKESYASRPTRTTAPSVETTQVLTEGFELANRWKKLAGLL